MDSKTPPFATVTSEESRSLFDKATAVSSHYCVILNFPEANGIGSGTLVSIAGEFGILTAHHVSELLQRTNDRFMICLGDTPTSLTVCKPQYRNIVVGQHRKTFEHLGPDLSFIQIINPKLLSTLKAKKSFHPLDENVVPAFNSEKLKEMDWIVSGAPDVLTQKARRKTADNIYAFTHGRSVSFNKTQKGFRLHPP